MNINLGDKKLNISGKKIYCMIGLFVVFMLFAVSGCKGQRDNEGEDNKGKVVQYSELKFEKSVPLEYATEFKIDKYQDGISLITINEDKYLIVPEGIKVENADKAVTVINQPLADTYLASSSAMDLICAVEALDKVTMTGIKQKDWAIEEAFQAMQSGKLTYVGKYNEPDYELLLASNCRLAIENTMIYHNPEVKEKLEELGIPVLVERSSYEAEPLGRVEWIKLYGVLFGKEELADEFYNQVSTTISELNKEENTKKTVAYFYVTGNGAINVRKSKDYVSKLIEIAGGRYIFENLGDEEENALSTVNLQPEEFYKKAIDADVLIYNSTIVGKLDDIDSLIEICPMLKDFKAVKEGRVYCTNNNFFQRTCSMGEFAREVNEILHDRALDEQKFIYKLK